MQPAFHRQRIAAYGAAQNLPRGTEIRLVLLKDLNSGGSVLGEEVPFMVARDIVVNTNGDGRN